MKKIYINGVGCISAQKTFDSIFLENTELHADQNVLPLETPVYKDYIPPAAIRRMSNGVKNGIVASTLAMKEANLETVDAIITGTGLGCIDDSDKFLKAILDNGEQFLTPTSFIQSTHNTVGAQIALGLQCKAYNFTYVNGAVSFESALLDAKMQLETEEADSILVGGIDEINEYTASLFELAGFIKEKEGSPYKILDSETSGVVYGEGATFFVLENKQNENSYAEVVDISFENEIRKEDLESKLTDFLQSNALEISDIDAVILGFNGDVRTDDYFKILSQKTFQNTPQLYYKHLSGEYNTASAFGFWVGAKVMKTQQIPEILSVNNVNKSDYKTILLYNQYKGINHSFTLIAKC
ncbi:beta-ketoacyl synthase N-terminal-like domain-containing protein [Flavobacterium sp. 3HN19-14]|uniref:beta-ketoacyl synthase N-terminal-like domain-containing protein n=1 Tax=Flavobacterium sp. 3HN19-14 TaxID=3448133 RepID=UPI003EDEE7D8